MKIYGTFAHETPASVVNLKRMGKLEESSCSEDRDLHCARRKTAVSLF